MDTDSDCRGCLRFAVKSFDDLFVLSELGMQELDRDFFPDDGMPAQINRAHSSSAEQSRHAVTADHLPQQGFLRSVD